MKILGFKLWNNEYDYIFWGVLSAFFTISLAESLIRPEIDESGYRYEFAGTLLFQLGATIFSVFEFSRALRWTRAVRDFRLSQRLVSDGEAEAALGMLEKCVRYFPRYAPYIYARGQAFLLMEDLSSALKDFSSAIELDSTLWEPYYARAETHRCLGNEKEAARDSRQAQILRDAQPADSA